MKKLFLTFVFVFVLSVPFISLADVQYTVLAPISGTNIEGTQTINEGYLSKYLNDLYLLGVGLCTALAVLMIIIGGVQWASSDAWSKKSEGKERIWSAVLGLLIALGSWVILNTINPDLLNTELDFGDSVTSGPLFATPVGPKTDEEKVVARTTPATIPQADPSYNPQFNPDGTMRVRSTFYNVEENGDEWTNNLQSSTGTKLRAATATQVGVAAVDPRIIPYGSLITVQTSGGPRYYVAADTGGAVKNQTASQGTAPVVDFFSSNQVGDLYTNVSVRPYTGSTPYRNLSSAQKESFFKMSNFTGSGN